MIDVKIDLFALVIILGVIQGFFLAWFFLTSKSQKKLSSLFLALILLSISLITLEIFLNYTTYITRIIEVNNFSEAFSFTLGPLLFLYVSYSLKNNLDKKDLLHFLPFLFWILYGILDFIQSPEYKFNCYLDVYHPKIQRIPDVIRIDPDPLRIRGNVNDLLIIQLLIYIILSIGVVSKAFKKEKLTFFSKKNPALGWLRNFTFLILAGTLMLIGVKTFFFKDLGDHLIASMLTFIIYATSFTMIKRSAYFRGNVPGTKTIKDKYAKSSLTEEEKNVILTDLIQLMEQEKAYLNSLVSLPEIAKKISIPHHHLSQVINEKLNQSFFEMIATYRIQEAKLLFADPEKQKLTIEEISEEIGYNSKSAFNKAFKNITGLTPSEYKNQAER